MKQVLTRREFGDAAGAGLLTAAFIRRPRAEEAFRLRFSLDTAPSHGRNQAIVDYLNKVEAASGGQIKPEVFHSGQLFSDLNVSKALVQGQVDMAAPGAWTLTGLVPDCDFFQLPMLYGQPIDIVHRATDGGAGALVAKHLETKLRSHVIGNWIDLGYLNWYTTQKPVHSLADLKGLKLRSPGGAAITWRITWVGAIPNTTAWPNVPLSLSQGTFDGLVSSDESCATAQLWEAGLRHSYADHQFLGQYIPMVSLAFWSKLPGDLQQKMTGLWAENIPAYRQNLLQLQVNARKAMEAHGVSFVDPAPEQISQDRKRMMADQDQMIKAAKLSPEIVKAVIDEVGAVG